MLVLWKELTPVTAQSSYPDLDDVYSSYVETASEQGWITGYADGRFKPYSTLSRQQMAIIMVRAMGWEDAATQMSADDVDQALDGFSDESAISEVARPYVATAGSKGLFGGDGDAHMNPKSGITRAQFCLVVFRAELSIRSVIQDVHSSTDWPDRTRLVLDLSKAPDDVTAYASADGILTVDYTGGAIAQKLDQPVEGSAEVQSVSALQLDYEPRTVRILVDLGRYSGFRVMSLAADDETGYRIEIDVYKRTDGPDGDGPPLVCIDPGHGGDASGAVGFAGTLEKDINLDISKYLADDLRKAGVQIIMTRDSDVAVDLHERAAIANRAKADVFVCVHNNAATDTDSNGTETFYWGDSAEWSSEGKTLAEILQRHLIAALGSYDRGAKTHWYDLVVLAETDMPAALCECGFLTNPAEEAKLLTPDYQQAAAQAICDGVLEYLNWSTTVYSTES